VLPRAVYLLEASDVQQMTAWKVLKNLIRKTLEHTLFGLDVDTYTATRHTSSHALTARYHGRWADLGETS
jgi:hypothetical protein